MGRRKLTAANFMDRRVSPGEVAQRFRERDAREAADTRNEIQRWLGDPAPGRAATIAKGSQGPAPRRGEWRVDLWKR
jgi:hypothetical protein